MVEIINLSNSFRIIDKLNLKTRYKEKLLIKKIININENYKKCILKLWNIKPKKNEIIKNIIIYFEKIIKYINIKNISNQKYKKNDNNNDNDKNYCIINYDLKKNPVLKYPNDNGELTWYCIDYDKEYKEMTINNIKIENNKYSIWKDNNKYYCIKHNNKGINFYKIINKNDMIFMNTVPNENDKIIDIKLNEMDNYDKFKCIKIKSTIMENAKNITATNLHDMHLLVNIFGDKKILINYNPNIECLDDKGTRRKKTYTYGVKNKIFGIEKNINVILENEYILPYTTITKITANDLSITIIIKGQPITNDKTRVYCKIYRNYLCMHDQNNPYTYPFCMIVNLFGDFITKAMIKKIIRTKNNEYNIFDVYVDALSNNYKNNYKKHFGE